MTTSSSKTKWILLFTLFAPAVHGQVNHTIRVRTESFDLAYAVNEDAMPLAAVHLWYTLDRGQTWLGRRPDPDRESPVAFHAPQEGLYGFYIVATNESGASSAAPVAGTHPHAWAFVDFTAPIVQLHSVQQSNKLGRDMIQIRWTAVDANLGPRPITISYCTASGEAWKNLTPEPMANTGQYDWVLPESFLGPVSVRVTVEDEGGHRVHTQSQTIDIAKLTPAAVRTDGYSQRSTLSTRLHDTNRMSAVSSRANRLFQNAMELKRKGDISKSIARLREVVRVQPDHSTAFVEMADMLSGLGDHDRALNAYELALRSEPTMRRALLGSARTSIKQKNHNAAAKSLRMVLQQTPDDAQSWLRLGDVAVFQGDEILARECYTRATQVDPNASDVVTEAQKRLAVMSSVSRAYRPSGR